MTDQPDATIVETRLRWYHLTPDRLVVGLLAMEVLLYLSERFRWLPFNEHKGWTVLIAVASVGMFLLLMMLWCAAAVFFRRRFQFSLRSLLVLVVVVAIPSSWLATQMRQAARQKEAVEAIGKAGGVHYDRYNPNDPFGFIGPPFPKWVRNLVGDDFFRHVKSANVWDDAGLENLHVFAELDELDLYGTDEILEHLPGLPRVETVRLMGDPLRQFTDAGLVHLKKLPHLHSLYLQRASITGAGLVHLKKLPDLRDLGLYDTDISDAVLGHLAGLHLTTLNLGKTSITDAGLAQLKELAGLSSLRLRGTAITDAGLRYLKGLNRLAELDLADTKITDAGLESLMVLDHLEALRLLGTQVTSEGVRKLRKALPNCRIGWRPPHDER